ncbi:MAG: ABC transporter ATP-binding protein [Candidatus Magnetoovum sp. WYHC-5]|nr:ABC transporter ATP-binding protein [Candidatus Magnetoovum sp. WYHC-5]
METVLSVKNLSKKYKIYVNPTDRLKEIFYPGKCIYHKEFWALRDITFDVERGEAFGIIGRNGSGKSTLLQIVCGILQKTAGEVHANGRICALLELGAGFDPEFTGRNNVYMNGALMGFTPAEMLERVQDIIEFAEIGDFIDQPVKFYSSGMYVRLAFSCAVKMQPDILVIDEALSVGDVFFQQKCYKLIRQIMESGTTCIFVSHDTTSIMNLCKRTMLLVDGCIDYVGPSQGAVSRYLSRYKKAVTFGAEVMAEHVKIENTISTGIEITKNNILKPDGMRHGANGIEIQALRVSDEFNRDTQTVHMLKPLHFDLLLKANEYIEGGSTNIHIYDKLGNNVFACGNHLLGQRLPPLNAGEKIVVRMTVTFNVRPAEYTYAVGVGEPSGKGLHDRHEMLGPILVIETFKGPPPFHGMAKLPFEVSYNKLNDNEN